MTNSCPRCQDANLSKEKKTYSGIEVSKSECNVCGTRWFFEEDIIAFVNSLKTVTPTISTEKKTKE